MTEKELLKSLSKTDSRIKKLWGSLRDELWNAGKSIKDIPEDSFFSFDDYPEKARKVAQLLEFYTNSLTSHLITQIKSAFYGAFSAQSLALRGFSSLSDAMVSELRNAAYKAYLDSRIRPDKGLSLSQRVWNYLSRSKAEFEASMSMALEKGITEGKSAEAIGRSIRQYLNNPDMMYRRYHLKKVLKNGTKRDIVEWRRKVVDADGKVHFVAEDLEQTGRGVARSSRSNALRLAATEINMAYRYADCVRWQNEKFVLGIQIQLSNTHPELDICDDLIGMYPKWYLFRGWHPRCKCYATPIMMDEEEYWDVRKLKEEDRDKYVSPNLVLDMPENYTKYIEDNKERIEAAYNRGTTPYWIADNYVDGNINKGLYWKNGVGNGIAEEKEIKKFQGYSTFRQLQKDGFIGRDFQFLSSEIGVDSSGCGGYKYKGITIPIDKIDIFTFKDTNGIEFAYPIGIGSNEGFFSPVFASKEISKLPERLRIGIKRVSFLNRECPVDVLWKVLYNNPNHRSMATDGGDIHFWISPSSINQFKGVISHEAAHSMDSQLSIYSASRDWIKAVKLDDKLQNSVKRRVSQYAETNQKENFAECVKWYILDKGWFSGEFPNCSKYIESLIG